LDLKIRESSMDNVFAAIFSDPYTYRSVDIDDAIAGPNKDPVQSIVCTLTSVFSVTVCDVMVKDADVK
jgi:hypothetical protein